MQRRRMRLPSPAIVIAMIALSLALGGTAIAAGSSTLLTSRQVAQIVKKLAPKLTVKNAKNLGGKSASAYERTNKIMWAVVTNDGSTGSAVRSTAGVTADRCGDGCVTVTFPRAVSACAWTATQGNPGDTYVPDYFATVRGNGNANEIEVITYDNTGTQVDANFHILVTC